MKGKEMEDIELKTQANPEKKEPNKQEKENRESQMDKKKMSENPNIST